jgi:proline iminopeptidase
VIVLHGGPSFGSRYLEEALRPLARSHTLLFYDQRGRGRSSAGGSSQLGLDVDLADLDAVRQHYALAHLVIVGHHYGAGLGAIYAMRHPGIVTRMAGIGPIFPRQNYVYDLSRLPQDSASLATLWTDMAHGGDTVASAARCARNWEWWLTPAVESDPGTVAVLGPALCDSQTVSFRAGERINRSVIQSLGQWDWRDSARSIHLPVLIIQGEGRGVTVEAKSRANILRHAAETWAGFLPDSRLLVLRGPAWFPWVEREREFEEALEEFLAGGWPKGATRVEKPPATPTPLASLVDSVTAVQ